MSNVIGRNLKVLREANDLTQEQMSSYLGIGRSAYANYEAGERETPLEVLERSASLLGCELELLFEEDVETVKDRMMVCAFRTDGLIVPQLPVSWHQWHYQVPGNGLSWF